MNETTVAAWIEHTQFFGITIANAALAVGVALLVYFAMTTALRFTLRRASRLAGRTASRTDDILVEVFSGTHRGLIALASLLIGLGMLDLSDRWHARVSELWFVALALQLALWANRAIGIALRRHIERQSAAGGSAQAGAAATLLSWGVRTLLWAVVLLAMLSNMGVNITAFVASLGVGGIAIALAAQNILGDLFASLAIAVDKPFEVGDTISVNAVTGTVEAVGVKTTRIRSIGGEQVVISNTDLLKQTISNLRRLQQRRIVFAFGITYDATPETVEAIPGIVRGLVEASPRLRFDRAHFKTFGDSSLDFECVYFVLDPGYLVYMDEQQRINLALMREFAARGIEFAFPTRTLHLASMPGEAPALPAGVR